MQAGQIRRQLQVDRPALAETGLQHPVDFLGGVFHGDACLGHGELAQGDHDVVVVAVAQGVVHQGAVDNRVQGRHAGNHDDRDPLGIGAGNAVEGAQVAHPVGRQYRAKALGAGVAVGGIGGVEFVAVTDEAQLRQGFDLFEQGQVVVAGHAEQVADAEFLQATQEKIANGHIHDGVNLVSPLRGRATGL
ncbi:hypothetical protein D3C77_500670 [compost metagenome]